MSTYEIVVLIVGSILGSTGLWAFIDSRLKRKDSLSNKKDAQTQLLLGLAHDRILYLGMCYINRGYITQDEYENLYEYLYKPYASMGGNGSGEKIMKEVNNLPIKSRINEKGGNNYENEQ